MLVLLWTGRTSQLVVRRAGFYLRHAERYSRLLALTFSRPGTISCRHNVPIPQLIDDEYLSTVDGQEGSQPDHLPSRMGLFVGSVQLFEIMEKVLAVFYDPQGETDASHSSSSNWGWSVERSCDALRLNEELERLLQALPGHLTSLTASGDKGIYEDWQVAHAAYFRARYLSPSPLNVSSRGTSHARLLANG
jgi:hypothetical protein